MIAYIPGILIILAIVAAALGGMWWGWRRRSRRDAGLVAPLGEPLGEVTARFGGLYVATTRRDAPLDRLAIRHLAFRSRVAVTVTTQGVALELPGEPVVFLDADRIEGAGRATWTIDRVVEREGLVVLRWRNGDAVESADPTLVDSYIRLQTGSPDDLVAGVEELRTRPAGHDLRGADK